MYSTVMHPDYSTSLPQKGFIMIQEEVCVVKLDIRDHHKEDISPHFPMVAELFRKNQGEFCVIHLTTTMFQLSYAIIALLDVIWDL